jgi:hypothetical protein
MGQMNIYEVLSSGKWSLNRKADWPIWMRIGSKSVPEGEETLKFGLDLKVVRTSNGVKQAGNYIIDARAFQNGNGKIKLKLTFDGQVTVWDIDNLQVIPKDEHTISSGEMILSYAVEEFEHVRWFENIPE